MLKPEQTALVLVDVQGNLAQSMFQRDRLFHNLRVLIQGIQILKISILWLEQYPKGLGPTIPEIAELLPGQQPISKLCFSGCGQPEFCEQLRAVNRRSILMAGIECHVCVYQTARDLIDRGFHVEAVADAISSRTPENRQIGLDKMARAGAEITSVETALFELMREAGTPQFKQIVPLVK